MNEGRLKRLDEELDVLYGRSIAIQKILQVYGIALACQGSDTKAGLMDGLQGLRAGLSSSGEDNSAVGASADQFISDVQEIIEKVGTEKN